MDVYYALDDSIVLNNLSWAGRDAIYADGLAGLIVSANTADHAGDTGLALNGSSGATVTNNDFGFSRSPRGAAIQANGLTDSSFVNNSATAVNLSLDLEHGSSLTVLHNNLSASGCGLKLQAVSNSTVIANQLYADHDAFWTANNSDVWIYHNNFVDDAGWVNVPSAQRIFWDAGYPQGGNYWSNYTGPDVSSGPNQTWGGSDGIVDQPFSVNATNRDHFPLTSIWPGFWFIVTESGLASSTAWTVVLNGATYSSTTNVILIPQSNGPGATYEFSVPRLTGYWAATPASGGPWLEARANITIPILFSAVLFPAQFQEFGLAPGTVWSVVVGSRTVTSITAVGTTPLANGSYAWVAGKVPGYTIAVGSGTVVVQGGLTQITIVYAPLTTGSSSGGSTPPTVYAAGALLGVVAATIILGVSWAQRRRPGRRPTAPSTWNAGTRPVGPEAPKR